MGEKRKNNCGCGELQHPCWYNLVQQDQVVVGVFREGSNDLGKGSALLCPLLPKVWWFLCQSKKVVELGAGGVWLGELCLGLGP